MHVAFYAVAVAYKALLYVYTLGSMSTIFVKHWDGSDQRIQC